MNNWRYALLARLRRRVARRYGIDPLPVVIGRRRIYIVPSRFGILLALLLAAMLVAALNFNSNLGLAFTFLMASIALVAMHHCNRNLLGLSIDAATEIDAFAGQEARFEFIVRNVSRVDRGDIEILCDTQARPRGLRARHPANVTRSVAANTYEHVSVALSVPTRGVLRLSQFELRTRYPFGWFRAWTYVQGTLTAYVAPRPDGSRRLPAAAASQGQSRAVNVKGDEEFSGLRDYQPGMPLKHMAWKVLARGGGAAVRTYEGLAAQPEWLDFDLLPDLDAEARLSQLCRWVLESDAAQRVYGLRLPGIEIAAERGPAHRSQCLRALAAFKDPA